MSPDQRSLDTLLNRFADGLLTPGELAELERRLAGSPEARRHWLRFCTLHAELAWRGERQAASPLPLARMEPFSPEAPANLLSFPRPSRSAFQTVTWAAAACLALAGTAALLWPRSPALPPVLVTNPAAPRPQDSPAAVIALARDAMLEGGRVLRTGDPLPTGLLHLTRGELGLRFRSGAEATVRAPARFAAVSPMELRVDEGSAAVRAPDPVNGFNVRTPAGALVDLGTEFATTVRPDGSSRMLVREGKVVASLLGPNGTSTRELAATEGQVVVMDKNAQRLDTMAGPAGKEDFPARLRFPAPPLQPSPRFEEGMRTSAPLAWWRFSGTADGKVPNEMAPGRWDATACGSARVEAVSAVNHAARLGDSGGPSAWLIDGTFPDLAQDNRFTLEMWICPDSQSQATLGGLVLETDPPAPAARERHLSVLEIMPPLENQMGLIHAPNALRFLHRLPSGTPAGCNSISDTPVIPARWHYVAGVCDGQTLRIYLDGKEAQQAPAAPQSFSGAFHLVLGKLRAIPDNAERTFRGWMDEAALHRRALPAAEIAARWEAMEIK